MSRAFVKESDGDELLADRAQRRHSGLPNYITPAGESALRVRLAALSAEREALEAATGNVEDKGAKARLDDTIRFLSERLERAIVVAPPEGTCEEVKLGARVRLEDAEGEIHEVAIVGEDEIDAGRGLISWCSPLGRAVMGCGPGEEIVWERPIGDLTLTILDIDYPR